MGWVIAAVWLAAAALIGGGIWADHQDNSNVNRINNQFQQHCDSLGGYTINNIDKDVCLKPSVVLDHQ
jgi:hypothetical protein